MESILKGRAGQICSIGETLKVTLFLEQPRYIEWASERSAPIFLVQWSLLGHSGWWHHAKWLPLNKWSKIYFTTKQPVTLKLCWAIQDLMVLLFYLCSSLILKYWCSIIIFWKFQKFWTLCQTYLTIWFLHILQPYLLWEKWIYSDFLKPMARIRLFMQR